MKVFAAAGSVIESRREEGENPADSHTASLCSATSVFLKDAALWRDTRVLTWILVAHHVVPQ